MIGDSQKEATLKTLEAVMDLYPELRVGQLIMNALYPTDDLFLMSDSKLRERLEELASKYSPE